MQWKPRPRTYLKPRQIRRATCRIRDSEWRKVSGCESAQETTPKCPRVASAVHIDIVSVVLSCSSHLYLPCIFGNISRTVRHVTVLFGRSGNVWSMSHEFYLGYGRNCSPLSDPLLTWRRQLGFFQTVFAATVGQSEIEFESLTQYEYDWWLNGDS